MKKLVWAGLCLLIMLSLAALSPAPSAFAAQGGSLSMTRLLFVDDVAGLSQYTPKQGDRFAIGDICAIYIETEGFALAPNQDAEDQYSLDLAADVEIRMPRSRRVIVDEKGFSTVQTTVRSQLPATFMAFSFLFDEAWDPGRYIIKITLRDNLSGQSATGELAYLLEEPTDADLARQAEEMQAQ